jgi:hypothetical protein
MSASGGTGPIQRAVALAVSLLLACSMAACTYEGDIDPEPEAGGSNRRAAPALPTKDQDVLSVETSNFAELKKRLAVASGSILLDDSGPADGPGVGFQKSATVTTSGKHTVTAACVGTDSVQILLTQDPETGVEPLSLEFECSQALSQVVELQAGYVGVHLMRNDPTGPWTGAVAGIKITVE